MHQLRRPKPVPSAIFAACLYTLIGCGGGPLLTITPEESGDPYIRTSSGRLLLESEYIPGVVACEIGHRNWGVAAMEAQAIAARTYLMRFLERTKGKQEVPIGPRFQCWKRTQKAEIISASRNTAGVIMRYQGRLITGNYVSGTTKLTFDCEPKSPAESGYQFDTWQTMLGQYRRDRKKYGRTRFKGTNWTEIFVTRNEGRSGADVAPSAIARTITSNRGALSQNAAVCLSNNLGYETHSILRYFFGEDIEISAPSKANETNLSN